MGILQARILECVAMPSYGGSSQPWDRTHVSCIAGGFFYQMSHQRSPTHLLVKVAQSCLTLWDPMDYTVPWNSLGQYTGVGSLSLLQGIFPTQGLNPGFLCCRRILYQLSHKGSPRILGWVAYPFSSGSSRPRICIS